ncbi:MAG TPA: 5-(carboxyamino)imidazole ribonucleotide synthase [Thiobacillaceae bacterium]|nr:5-(carboxyamino)imidazole ribonucleotide synthase [Thiobacillaceae bacterium]HNA81477.1 5-(carboxyamino)imidazole ribonucleotide synthase [Thiobacillaceae bacterium]HNF88500.1 5-(carboxyamino)imidazole ribonucleotide synthase [Thiobacillaceae bacterium]HNH89654.1 5-(carboxyamino)imidazole ribonucleotide synthase [Thiobacillaceae bacterium]
MNAGEARPPLLPGATLGVLGGGQLGRMFTLAAKVMGYKVVVLDPDPSSPAGQLADVHLKADYRDAVALLRMGGLCQAITTEFENVPAESLEMLAKHCRVAPAAAVLAVAQDRLAEKSRARAFGCDTAPFANIETTADLAEAWTRIGAPALLKTRRLGYDGKGQVRVDSLEALAAAFDGLGGVPCLLEGFLPLEREVSVVLARNDQDQLAFFPLAENRHRAGILDYSIVPARVSATVADRALDMAARIARGLDYVGVMAVEFFVLADGRIVFNEMAPRPHNSGHYTLDACATDQFQQQVRALCGLPLGDPRLLTPVVMVNLLGDVWRPEPPWEALLGHAGLQLHLYGKAEARPGRKMGHYNCLGDSLESALALALETRASLGIDG